MAWIDTVKRDAAGDELRELFELVADPETGDLDNIMAIHGLHPAGLRAHIELYRAVMAGTVGLRRVDREMIALLVSKANACDY